MGDVIVTVVIEIDHNIKSVNSSANFQLWLGEVELSAVQEDVDDDDITKFKVRMGY